jgi:hypothetical protein
LYPSPVVTGMGGSVVPKPLGSLAPSAPLRALTRTPTSASATPEMAYPESGGSAVPRFAGGMLEPWVNRHTRGFSYAIVLTPEGRKYHWIWWSSVKEYYYLFDSAAARYVGVYDRVARAYRPLDGASRRWGQATAAPVLVPSYPPAIPGSPASAIPVQLPAHRENSGEGPAP